MKMCGYSAFLYTQTSRFYSDSHLKEKFICSSKNISHRGNEPLRTKFYKNIFLAHARLAFQDLINGIQPFVSQDGKWVIIFNGEIYNFKSIKEKIKKEFKETFITESDTEVILLGFLKYGSKIINLLEGEFSFVIFNTDGSEVFAARDNFGVKPLFIFLEETNTKQFSNAQELYSFQTQSMNFSSEMKGLFPQKKWNRDGFIRQAVGLYEPIRTPFENIIALPANSYLHGKRNLNYFSVKIYLNSQSIRKSSFNLNTIHSSFSKQIEKSVHERALSDVELGLYLSSGIDSKIICYELEKYYRRNKTQIPLKAFHLSFTDKKYDESNEVKKFANQFRLNLNILKINKKSLEYSYPQAVYYSENIQPYTNGAAKWWLSLFASQQVKGVLTGDGADELLCGYPSFRYANWWKFALRNRPGIDVFDKLKHLPLGQNWRDSIYLKKYNHSLKNPWATGFSQTGLGNDFIESLILWGVPHPLFEQIKAIAISFLGEQDAMMWLKEQRDSIQSWFTFGLSSTENFLLNPENTLLLWQNYFCKTHLPVQILNWVGDRMEMANTLEGRTPFLSTHIKNMVYNLSDFNLIRGFQEKSILKVNYNLKLNEFISNSKKQFNAPLLSSTKNKKKHQVIIERLSQNNLLEKKVIKTLFENQMNNENIFLNTRLNMAMQTMECFSLVDEFLVQDNKPKRDQFYEESILKSAV